MNLGRLSDQKNASEYKHSGNNSRLPRHYATLIVGYSTHLAEQKKATFAQHLQKEQLQLEKAAEELTEQEFLYANDTQKA